MIVNLKIFKVCKIVNSISTELYTLPRPLTTGNPTGPFKILLVDDEPGIRKILRLFLELDGFEVFEAITANQAMDVIKKDHPHLVILDVILCGQTGYDVCEWVKSSPETSNIIVFLFTALNQEHDYREGQRVGCDLYLTKPQNPKEIIQKVHEYLEKFPLTRQL